MGRQADELTLDIKDHSDPSISLPSGTGASPVVTAAGASLRGAIKALEDALGAESGALRRVRRRPADDGARLIEPGAEGDARYCEGFPQYLR
jgi:hypothetical protein